MGCGVTETVVDVGAFRDAKVHIVERHDRYEGLWCEMG